MKFVRLFRNSFERKFWDVLNRKPKKYEKIINDLEKESQKIFKNGMEIRMYDFDSMVGALEEDEILEIANFKFAFQYSDSNNIVEL